MEQNNIITEKKGMSGYTEAKKTKKNIDSSKFVSPKAKKVTALTPSSKGSKSLAMQKKMDPVGNEGPEKIKKPNITPDKYKGECMGVDVEVKGVSNADINIKYIVANAKKYLEGKGQVVSKIKIEMSDKDSSNELKESRESKETLLKQLIKNIIMEVISEKNAK